GVSVGVLNGRADKDLKQISKRCAIRNGRGLKAPSRRPNRTRCLRSYFLGGRSSNPEIFQEAARLLNHSITVNDTHPLQFQIAELRLRGRIGISIRALTQLRNARKALADLNRGVEGHSYCLRPRARETSDDHTRQGGETRAIKGGLVSIR